MNRGRRIAVATGATLVLQMVLFGGVAVAGDQPTDGFVPRVGDSTVDPDPWAVVSEPNLNTIDGWAHNTEGGRGSGGHSFSFAAADAGAGYVEGLPEGADGWVAAGTNEIDAPSFAMVDRLAGFPEAASTQPIQVSSTDLTEYIGVGLLMLLLGATVGGAAVYAMDHRRTPLAH